MCITDRAVRWHYEWLRSPSLTWQRAMGHQTSLVYWPWTPHHINWYSENPSYPFTTGCHPPQNHCGPGKQTQREESELRGSGNFLAAQYKHLSEKTVRYTKYYRGFLVSIRSAIWRERCVCHQARLYVTSARSVFSTICIRERTETAKNSKKQASCQ